MPCAKRSGGPRRRAAGRGAGRRPRRQLRERAEARAGEHARPEAVGERDEQPVAPWRARRAGQRHRGDGTRRFSLITRGELVRSGFAFVLLCNRPGHPGPADSAKGSSSMAATEALVFDAIRTPRGKGKSNGSLHATKPVDLVVGPDARDARPQRAARSRTGSTTSCSAASRPSATRAPTSPRPPRSRPACRTRSPASSSTASAPRASRPSTSPPRRSPPAGRTSSSPAASSRCRACRWAPTAAPGRWTRRPTTTRPSSRRAIGADLIATVEGFTRDDVDAYAARSQERAAAAQRGRQVRRLASIPVLRHQRARRARPRRVHPPRHDGRDARQASSRRSR